MTAPIRYFGLDIHKFFMVAIAVDAEKYTVFGPPQMEELVAILREHDVLIGSRGQHVLEDSQRAIEAFYLFDTWSVAVV